MRYYKKTKIKYYKKIQYSTNMLLEIQKCKNEHNFKN